MAKVGGFKVEASGFEGGEEGLNAPASSVVGEGGLRGVVGGENQEFAIGQTGGDEVDSSAPDPAFAR
jgi:hypothetical protein